MTDIKELVDGKIFTPAVELDAPLTSSDTGEFLYSQRESAPEQVEAALSAAATTHADGTWFELPAADKAASLRRLQGELMARAEELGKADSLDSGVPLAITTMMSSARIGLMEVLIAKLEEGFAHSEHPTSIGTVDRWRLPWGPAAIMTPWNAPAPTGITKIADALVAGCPVILKPSEWAPHFSGPFVDAVVAADLPAGAVQVVHGGATVGAALVGDERIAAVSYTGGVIGGTKVAEACARQLKPADLELSGNNPVLALPDADPMTVATAVVMGMLFLNGQICSGPRRLIVPEDKLPAYVESLTALLEPVILSTTEDPATQLGPLAHAGHRDHLESQIAGFASRGCEVLRFGTLPAAGHFLRPAVILADPAPDLRDEVFGPVLIVRTYTDTDEAVDIANDHAFGLSAYVFDADRDVARAYGRKLRAGLVTANNVLGGQAEVWAMGSAWGASGLGIFGVGTGPDFFSGHRFVG